jgi:hypothetical protein
MQDGELGSTVVIPQQVIADSNAKKARKKKTLPELPVYRASANLKFVIAEMMTRAPRRLTKFYDEMLMTSSELSKSIGLADISLSSADRVWYINSALTLAYSIRNDFTIMFRLGVIGRDFDNKAKSLVKSIVAQLVAWRDYTGNQGV